MIPYYADESVTLYHGEALAVLASLPTGSVDAVVADPPYSSGGMMRGDRAQATVAKYVTSQNTRRDELLNFSGDSRDQRSYAYWSALWLSEAHRVTAPGGVCLTFSDWRQLPATTDSIQALVPDGREARRNYHRSGGVVSLTARIGAASDEWLRSLSRRVLRLGAALPATRRQGREWRAEGSSLDRLALERPYGCHQGGGSREPDGVVPVPPNATVAAGVERPLHIGGAGRLRLPGWSDASAVLAVSAVQRGSAVGGHGLDRCHRSARLAHEGPARLAQRVCDDASAGQADHLVLRPPSVAHLTDDRVVTAGVGDIGVADYVSAARAALALLHVRHGSTLSGVYTPCQEFAQPALDFGGDAS